MLFGVLPDSNNRVYMTDRGKSVSFGLPSVYVIGLKSAFAVNMIIA